MSADSPLAQFNQLSDSEVVARANPANASAEPSRPLIIDDVDKKKETYGYPAF